MLSIDTNRRGKDVAGELTNAGVKTFWQLCLSRPLTFTKWSFKLHFCINFIKEAFASLI
jgi:hypothetical protein